ncbi:protein RRP5 homolog [Watersipora subatra]|uniref:protein RRP5 homolog n=1 Tax=Watersipora subatra TaxID=2589382 RepID=UPI00355C207F
MSTNDLCFPRGGTEKAAKHISTDDCEVQILAQPKLSKSLKKPAHKKTGISSAKKFKVKKKASSKNATDKQVLSELDSNLDTSAVIFTPERLSTKKIGKGTKLLAAVKEIRDYELRVNLPNNIIGCVSITHMPDAYTNLLKRFAQSADDSHVTEELHSLEELFTIGQVLPCTCIDEASGNLPLQLSINPAVLHKNLSSQSLREDLVLYGSVSSIEDHGIHIDIGIPNIAAFMPTAVSTDLYVGMVRRFRVTESDIIGLASGESRTIRVTMQTEEDKNEHAWTDKNVQFNSVLPGMLVAGKIQSRKTEGLVVQLGQLKGYAHVSHLSRHVKDYSTGKVNFRVLCVNDTTKYIHLTELSSLVDHMERETEGPLSIPIGEPITVIVKKIVDKYAFVMTEEGSTSYMGVSLLPEKMRSGSSKLKDVKLKCFWFGWDYLEKRPIFSTIQRKIKKSVLPTLVPGAEVEGRLVSMGSEGAKVSLASGLHAFIQNMHLTEVPLKNPEKKLKVGQKLHCRILSVNRSTKRVRLTAKPSLVGSTLPVIADLESVKVGSLLQGVIVKITTGALVSFYNNVVGFVHSSQLAKEEIEKPADVFYVGQSVTCRVLSCDPQRDKLALSFVLDEDKPRGSKRKSEAMETGELKRVKAARPAMTVGQVVADWSVVSVKSKGSNVVSKEGHFAFLPHTQLSDMPGLSDIITSSVRPGTTFDSLVCITANSSHYQVSNQALFKYYAAKDGLGKSWENLKVNAIYPGFVLSQTEHGLFVSLGNELIGLCPERLLPVESSQDLLPGRSVLAAVSSIDMEKKRMVVKLTAASCPLPAEDSIIMSIMLKQNLLVLDSHLKRAESKGIHAQVSGYNVGDLVNATILERNPDIVKMCLDDGIIAEAKGEQMAECKAAVGKAQAALVVHVDVINDKLTVLLDKNYLRYFKDKQKDDKSITHSKVKVGQNIKCDILHVRPEYALLMLRGHAHGQIAFAPTLQHPNGLPCTQHMIYAQRLKACIKISDKNGLVIATLQTEKEKLLEKAEKIRADQHLPAPGEVMEAIVTGKQDLQLNLKVGKGTGRVPLHEISSCPQYGLNPLDEYKLGQNVEVKVLNARMIVSDAKQRSIKNAAVPNVMLDCSIRQTDPTWKSDGDKVTDGYYTCYVTEHDAANFSRLVHVITTAGKQAVISWHQLGQRGESSADLLSKFPVGVCLKCRPVATGKDGVCYMQVISDEQSGYPEFETESNVTYGMTVRYSACSGLTLNTPLDPVAHVPLSEMTEAGMSLQMTQFKPGQVFRCQLVKTKCGGHAVMTLRQKSGLLQLGELKVGMHLPAVVSVLHPSSVSVISAGHKFALPLSAGELQTFKQNYTSGSACWITVTSTKSNRLEAVLKTENEKRGNKSLPKVATGTHLSPASKVKEPGNIEEGSLENESEPVGKKRKKTKVADVIRENILENKKDAHSKTKDNAKSVAAAVDKKQKKKTITESVKENFTKNENKAQLKTTADKKRKKTKVAEDVRETITDNEKDAYSKAKGTLNSATTKRKAAVDVVDAETGVHIVVKRAHSDAPQQPVLDFGASITSLQTQYATDASAVELKLDQLEKVGKGVQKRIRVADQADVILARKVELSTAHTSNESARPQTEAEYLLLLKKSPNNGAIWSKLIAYTAAHKGVEAGRTRAEQALQTVSYRMENEKLIVWTAFIRLEMIYGTDDSMDSVKRRALQQMNELKVYRELVKLYLHDGEKVEEAEQCHTMMLRKWSENPQVWIEYGQFLFSQKKRDAARTLLQRCLKSLPVKQHIEVITKFAVMELKEGDFERFTALFENVISNFPKRTDVWSVYVDQLIKFEKHETARMVLRRAVMQKWNAKKMQFFAGKFRDFETQHGTDVTLKEADQLINTL